MNWTEEKNNRRIELIDRNIDEDNLTIDESLELADLTIEFHEWRKKTCPIPPFQIPDSMMVLMFAEAAKKILANHSVHEIWCNFQSGIATKCNCGLADLQFVYKQYNKLKDYEAKKSVPETSEISSEGNCGESDDESNPQTQN